jgi:hypothetical protein
MVNGGRGLFVGRVLVAAVAASAVAVACAPTSLNQQLPPGTGIHPVTAHWAQPRAQGARSHP